MSSNERRPPRSELRRDFGLDVRTLEPCSTGFESECWVVDARWFVKVWRAGAQPMDLGLLGRLADAGLPVPRPLRDDIMWTDDGRSYAVFPFVHGRHATGDDWSETARVLRQVHEVPTSGLGLCSMALSSDLSSYLRSRLDHPWLASRASELSESLDRYETVLRRARSSNVAIVLSHGDFGGLNLLLDDDGRTLAILNWDSARLAPREHDLWLVIDETRPRSFLRAYGVSEFELDVAHLEYGLIRRALDDIATRVARDVDRPGISKWGFDRLVRIDEALASFL